MYKLAPNPSCDNVENCLYPQHRGVVCDDFEIACSRTNACSFCSLRENYGVSVRCKFCSQLIGYLSRTSNVNFRNCAANARISICKLSWLSKFGFHIGHIFMQGAFTSYWIRHLRALIRSNSVEKPEICLVGGSRFARLSCRTAHNWCRMCLFDFASRWFIINQ